QRSLSHRQVECRRKSQDGCAIPDSEYSHDAHLQERQTCRPNHWRPTKTKHRRATAGPRILIHETFTTGRYLHNRIYRSGRLRYCYSGVAFLRGGLAFWSHSSDGWTTLRLLLCDAVNLFAYPGSTFR